MADTLQVDFIPGQSVYFLIRDQSGLIYNGSGLVSYNSANYAQYDVPATEQGSSGYYMVAMPALGATVYNIVAKQRVTGSPLESDPSIGWGQIQWDGSAVLPLSGIAATVMTQTNLNSIAATVLSYDLDNVEDTAAIHSLCGAALKLVSRFDVRTGALSALTYKTDGTTIFMQQAKTTDATLSPIRSLGVGA